MGSPIALVIWNRDWANWSKHMDPWAPPPARYHPVTVPRPGHADLPGALKYRHTDIRNVLERASARETAMRVALGAIARQLLEYFGIQIASHVVQIHTVRAQSDPSPLSAAELTARADASPVRCLDPHAQREMIACIDRAQAEGNTPVKAHVERSDVCAVPAASVIGEALLALVLADAFLEKYGGDSIAEIAERYPHKI
jgi:chorismate synthase